MLAAAAFHTRTVGVALLASGCLSLWLARKRRQAAVYGILAAALCLPWIVWVATQSGASSGEFYSLQNYQNWNILLNFDLLQKIHIAAQNVVMALASPAALTGLPASGIGLFAATAIGVWLAWSGVRIGRGAITLFLAVYCGMVSLLGLAANQVAGPLAAPAALHRVAVARKPPETPVARHRGIDRGPDGSGSGPFERADAACG